MAQRTRSTAANIPAQVLDKLEGRLHAHAQANWPACKALTVRSRGAFAYVDAQGQHAVVLFDAFTNDLAGVDGECGKSQRRHFQCTRSARIRGVPEDDTMTCMALASCP